MIRLNQSCGRALYRKTLGRTDTLCTLPASAKTLTMKMFLLVTKSKHLAMCVETSGLFFSPGYTDFVPNVYPGLPADTIPRNDHHDNMLLYVLHSDVTECCEIKHDEFPSVLPCFRVERWSSVAFRLRF